MRAFFRSLVLLLDLDLDLDRLGPSPGPATSLHAVSAILESPIARAAGEAVRPDHLFADGGEPEPRMFHAEKDRVISAFESRSVRALLSRHSGNISAAAKEAHLARNALYALMKRAGVE